MKYKKRFLILGILGCMLIVCCLLMHSITRTANKTTVRDISLSSIKNGTYTGTYRITPVEVKIQVFVENHKIEDIKILHHMQGLGKPAQSIVKNVISQQSLQVDTITGATVSSKCILKAIEQALEGASHE